MRMALGNAPVSWGIDFAEQAGIAPWTEVFEAIAAAGYTWVELGPRGYVPDDVALVRRTLDELGLRVAGSFIFEPLHDAAALATVRSSATDVADRVAALGGRYLVIIDLVAGVRAATAGRSEAAPRATGADLDALVTAVDAAAAIAVERGLIPVLHPHAGSTIEFADEIEAVLGASSRPELGLCVDTGHAAYAGIDPAALIRRHADRVRYVHFKDLDRSQHAQAVSGAVPFFEAVARGVFCPIGQGSVDFAAVVASLEAIGYDGPGTVEQDRRADTPGDPFEAARDSLRVLVGAGIEPLDGLPTRTVD